MSRYSLKKENRASNRLNKLFTSGVPLIDWILPKERWWARCYFNGKEYSVGYFVFLEDAKEAQKNKLLELSSGQMNHKNNVAVQRETVNERRIEKTGFDWTWEYTTWEVGGKTVIKMPPLEVLDYYFQLDEAGSLWRIRNTNHTLKKEKVLAGKLNKDKLYLTETLRDSSGVKKIIYVHRLVFWLKHRRDIGEGYVINHRDRNKMNNHPDNLQEVTLSDNFLHG